MNGEIRIDAQQALVRAVHDQSVLQRHARPMRVDAVRTLVLRENKLPAALGRLCRSAETDDRHPGGQ